MSQQAPEGATESGFGERYHDWTLIAAVARNGVIGRENALPWRLRSDLQRFKRLTMGQCLLMGRKTFESIGKVLPGRQTIVLSKSTRDLGGVALANADQLRIASSLSEVQGMVDANRRIMVVGGEEVYRLTLPVCSSLWITRVLADIDGDTFFPKVDWSEWQLESSKFVEAGPFDEWPTEFERWHRKKVPN